MLFFIDTTYAVSVFSWGRAVRFIAGVRHLTTASPLSALARHRVSPVIESRYEAMAEAATIRIMNQTRGQPIATQAELARSFMARGRGLMGRRSLPAGYALIIYPEWSIHTFFMRVAIDVLFVDRANRVVGLRHAMPPSRPFAGVAPWRGHYVIEMPAGVLAATGTAIGDQLVLDPPLGG